MKRVSRLLRVAAMAATTQAIWTGCASAAEELLPERYCIRVAANEERVPTGIMVDPSEFVCVKGEGLWSHGGQGVEAIYPYYGPEGYARDNPVIDDPSQVLHIGALVGRIDGNYPFLIREQTCFIPRVSGQLVLGMDDAPGTYGNNDGSLRVRVEKWPVYNRPERIVVKVGCPAR